VLAKTRGWEVCLGMSFKIGKFDSLGRIMGGGVEIVFIGFFIGLERCDGSALCLLDKTQCFLKLKDTLIRNRSNRNRDIGNSMNTSGH